MAYIQLNVRQNSINIEQKSINFQGYSYTYLEKYLAHCTILLLPVLKYVFSNQRTPLEENFFPLVLFKDGFILTLLLKPIIATPSRPQCSGSMANEVQQSSIVLKTSRSLKPSPCATTRSRLWPRRLTDRDHVQVEDLRPPPELQFEKQI